MNERNEKKIKADRALSKFLAAEFAARIELEFIHDIKNPSKRQISMYLLYGKRSLNK